MAITLLVTNDGNGTTLPLAPVSLSVDATTTVDATAALGYHFYNWSVLNGSVLITTADSSRTVVQVHTDATIQANFFGPTYGTRGRAQDVVSPHGAHYTTRLNWVMDATTNVPIRVDQEIIF